ncbi:MAG: hypothetical protein JF619_03225, partial [Massilia sp.]|nr:hypothetical protein [Massilia sp.]
FSGGARSVQVTGNPAVTGARGLAGLFVRDDADTASADDGAMCIVGANRVRWKRQYAGQRINPLWFGADPSGNADAYPALQAACNFAASNGRLTVHVPAGKYRITRTVQTTDVNAARGSVACGFAGDGPYSTIFLPAGDFTAINIVTSYAQCGGFSVQWPATPAAAIPPTRIGVEFCNSYHQVSQTCVHDILVMYAYNAFFQRDWTGAAGGLGTMYVVDLERLFSFRAADYGFKLAAVNGGSTTHRFSTCWANCSDAAGAAHGKGFYLKGINDIAMTNCAVDLCRDAALSVFNTYQVNLMGFAMESCAAVTNGAALMRFVSAPVVNVVGLKDIAGTVNIPGQNGRACVVLAGAGTSCNVRGYARAALKSAAGTLYKVGVDGATARLDTDASVAFAEALDNGAYANISWGGIRYSATGKAPDQGPNQRGDYVRNMVPAVGQPKGWYCTAAGSPGTWVSEGAL